MLRSLGISFVCLSIISSCSPDVTPSPPQPVMGSFAAVVTDRTQTSATISWTRPSSPNGLALFKIYLFSSLIIQNFSDTTFNLTNLEHDMAYNGRVVAYSGSDSAVANFFIPLAGPPPPPPPPLNHVQGIVMGVNNLSTSPLYGKVIVYDPFLIEKWNIQNQIITLPTSAITYNNKVLVQSNNTVSVHDFNTGSNTSSYPLSTIGVKFRNDTMYAFRKEGSSNYLTAQNPFTGQQYWSVFYSTTNYLVDVQDIDGDLLAIRHYTPNTVFTIEAFDLRTRTIKWSLPTTGYNAQTTSPRIYISGNYFYSKTGGGSLLCIDKNTGTITWTKNTRQYTNPVKGGNRIFSVSDRTLYAFDAHTGADLWNINVGTNSNLFGQPYVYGDKIYLFGAEGWDNFFYALNTNDGSIVLKKLVNSGCTDIIIGGNKMLARGTSNTVNNNKIFLFDIFTGNKTDSILINPSDNILTHMVTTTGEVLFANP